MKKFIPLVFLALFAGCVVTDSPPRAMTDEDLKNQMKASLPDSAQFVESLGNGWTIFKMNVLGEERWYMMRAQGDYHGDISWAQQAVTEIRPPATYYGNPG